MGGCSLQMLAAGQRSRPAQRLLSEQVATPWSEVETAGEGGSAGGLTQCGGPRVASCMKNKHTATRAGRTMGLSCLAVTLPNEDVRHTHSRAQLAIDKDAQVASLVQDVYEMSAGNPTGLCATRVTASGTALDNFAACTAQSSRNFPLGGCERSSHVYV